MLADRIFINKKSGTFSVIQPEDSSESALYYKEFTLEDDLEQIRIGDMKSMRYWDGMRTKWEQKEIPLKEKCYIFLVEKKDGLSTAERTWFFYQRKAGRYELIIELRRRGSSRLQRWEMKIKWDGGAEKIAPNYICLKKRIGDSKIVPRGLIIPRNEWHEKKIYRYKFALPEYERIKDYDVLVDPLVRKQYAVRTVIR